MVYLVASAWKEPEAEAPAPRTGGEFVCGESYWALREAMEKVKSGFMDLPKEKADGKEQVEKLELGFIQLSEATDSMREYVTVYESQGAVPNTWHQDMEDVIRLAQNEEEMKVNTLELPKLVLPLVGDHEGHGKFFATPQNPADEPAPGAPAPEELGAAGKQGDFSEDTQEHPGLATKPCMPFFYRASENREINIIII
uniref:Golgin subfamily A conserved domain-containing protein n=1 Tax=Macaca mulatta TaxID=9544 RepID=A0A5F8AA72_MACMU